jgi:uncharacterized protein YabN with tetrapyrrole methylase and pyrophosphatase domain
MGVGSLTVVGLGYRGCGQITFESSYLIETAEKILYLTENTSAAAWLRQLNPNSESLFPFYRDRSTRLQSYHDMIDHIIFYVRKNLNVCVVFSGHPGVFVFPSHEAIIRARNEGFEARMLPAISAEDSLFSDLGVDPGRSGCQSFEATDFLVRRRQTDITVPLILWQIGVLGRIDYPWADDHSNLQILSDVLQSLYGPNHEVVIYEAAPDPACDPIIEFLPLNLLTHAVITPISTLFIPPKGEPLIDHAMKRRLGIPDDYLLNSGSATSNYSAFRPYASPKPRQRPAAKSARSSNSI